ncbi:unnamed protein product [Closterium sp. Yama58-4]|nr:unnamed protein product [Closterium sp. Yama58-4]
MQQCPGDSCISSTATAGLTQIVGLASEAAGAALAERGAEAGNIDMHKREAENQETPSRYIPFSRPSSPPPPLCSRHTQVQWSVCAALSLFLQNPSVHLPSSPWTAPTLATLQALLQRSTNFKIRIHAAAALIQPCARADYGPEFGAILHALVSSLASLDAVDEQQTAVEQRYKPVLRDQLWGGNGASRSTSIEATDHSDTPPHDFICFTSRPEHHPADVAAACTMHLPRCGVRTLNSTSFLCSFRPLYKHFR